MLKQKNYLWKKRLKILNPIALINNKTILISPLDWGFGHTTRCVSIIRDLLINQNKIIFAGNNRQIEFIKKEFPGIKTELIEGYNVSLSSEKSTYSQIGAQSLKILNAIKRENKWVNKYITTHSVDLILSDNRYGFRHPEIESIFISHQLNLELPSFQKVVNKKLIRYVNKFDSCWIPDDQKLNLSGTLSNSKQLEIPNHFIGLLSRFQTVETANKYDFLFIISGPNPEHGIFLREVETIIKESDKRIAIVSTVKSENPNSNTNYFHLPSSMELNQLINESSCVISKAGYTTIMEMVFLNKRAILIPTKGQYEQEYIAKHIKHADLEFIDSLDEIKV